MLNEEQKKFILEHHKDIPIRKLARQLKITRSEIEDFIQKSQKSKKIQKPSILINYSKYKKILIPLFLLLLILFHLSLRYNTFWLSHVRGDQVQYVGLAMKIDKFGFDGYSLRGIDLRGEDKEWKVAKVIPSKDKIGALLRDLKSAGFGYYDIPFFHKGPSFCVALVLSHSLFASDRDYLLVLEHIGEEVFKKRPKEFFDAQFYAVIVPLFFSAILMLLTYYLGRMLFSDRVGLYAAFIMAANPISILTSCKLWADDMQAAFVIASMVLFVISQRKQRAWISFLAGISCGIAVLAKQNSGVLFGSIIAYSIWANRHLLKSVKKWPLLIFDKYLMCYVLGLAILSVPWFYKVYKVYGNPLYIPISGSEEVKKTEWAKALSMRPHPLKLFTVGTLYLSPVFGFALGALKNVFSIISGQFKKKHKENDGIVLLVFWILAFVAFCIFFGSGKEHRRMLPFYPAIAILAAYVLNNVKCFIERITRNQIVGEMAIAAILISSAIWSAQIGISTVIAGDALIFKPF